MRLTMVSVVISDAGQVPTSCPVSHDGDVIRDLKYLIYLMRDIDDRDIFLLEAV